MEFWNYNLRDDPYKLQIINKKDIELAEKAFNIKLPRTYINLLKEQNGGCLEKTCLPVNFKNDWADDHILFDYLLGIKKDKGIMESNYLLKEWGVKEKNLIIISGDGHFFVALDYRTNEENPTVVYIDTTEDKITKIYEDFSSMVNSLYEEDEEKPEDAEEWEELRKHLQDSKRRSIELMGSVDTDDIVEGIHMHFGANAGFIQENDVFIEKLIKFIQHSNEEIRLAAAECLWRSISSGNIKDNKLINLVLDIFKNENHSDIKYFYNDIIENKAK